MLVLNSRIDECTLTAPQKLEAMRGEHYQWTANSIKHAHLVIKHDNSSFN